MKNRTSARISDGLLSRIRDRFAQVDHCPEQGARIFFENAGGALTLKSVLETSARFAAIPDNQGRDNPGSRELGRVIEQARQDMAVFMHAPGGRFFVGESGTELLFRLIRNACLDAGPGGRVLGCTLEHPATRSACDRWARIAGQEHVLLPHDNATGTVQPDAYAAAVTPDTKIATIVHASPVTGMSVDVAAVAAAVRATAPDCRIVVDGIQHAAHGHIDLAAYGVDGYVISPYKMFSRHGYGLAWISGRMARMAHDALLDGPAENWELGTRDAGAYATLSDVAAYFEWLGEQAGASSALGRQAKLSRQATLGRQAKLSRRAKFTAAGAAIRAHETALTDAMIHGTGNLPGLAEMPRVTLIGGADNPARAGLVSLTVAGVPSAAVVHRLNEQGIRTHLRKDDHYSGNILAPLGLDSCVRASLCHYNSIPEVSRFLGAMKAIAA